MRECIAIRHLPFEDLGYFDDVLREENYRVRYVDAPLTDASGLARLDPDLLIVLGGPLGANDEHDYPFLDGELQLLEQRLRDQRPTLGICLGGQLMARVLGATVTRAARGEVGWIPLTLKEPAANTPLRHFDTPVFHWHGDVFALPPGAASLASTPDCEHQAFAFGPNLLGLQFHPEVTPRGLETWYVGHYRALENNPRLDVHSLRNDAARFGAELETRGRRFLADWLRGLRHE